MTSNDDCMLYLSKKDVETVCQNIDSVALMREVLMAHGSGQTVLPDEAYLAWTNSKGERVRSLNMPSYVGGSFGIAGTKIINSNINNPSRGLPRASGLTLLYDNLSTRIVCIMEGAYLSSLRTASVTAMAIDLFQREPIQCAAIIGAGVLAQTHIELLVKRLHQLRKIQLFDVDEKRIARLQSDLAPFLRSHEVRLQAVSTAEAAIRPAQLIVPVTTTTTGYIHFEWLQPGSLLVNVSLDDPLPEVVLKADRVIVDDWNLVKNDSRRLIGRMYREGLVIGPDENAESVPPGARRIDAQLGEIAVGTKAGRLRTHDIILVNPFGLSIEDLSLAAHVYQKAQALGTGVRLVR